MYFKHPILFRFKISLKDEIMKKGSMRTSVFFFLRIRRGEVLLVHTIGQVFKTEAYWLDQGKKTRHVYTIDL